MSKLALLAQKRREEAQARASPSTPAPPSPALSASATPPSGASTPNAEAGPSKPLSKLAQKMAAARLAKLEAEAKPVSPPESSADAMDVDAPAPSMVESEPATSGLFAFPKQPKKTSPFFNLLTTKCTQTNRVDAKLSAVAHLPYVPDEEELERRVREAFGPDVESPDDIVLKARGGRAGTRVLTETGQVEEQPVVQPKKVKTTIREKQIISEVEKIAKEDGPLAEKAKVSAKGQGPKQRKGSHSTATPDGSRYAQNGRGELGGAAQRGGKATRGGRPANPSLRPSNGGDSSEVRPESMPRATPGAPRPPRAKPPQPSDTDRGAMARPQQSGKPRAPARQPPQNSRSPSSNSPTLPPLPTSNDPLAPRAAREKAKPKSKQVKGPP